MNNKLQEIIKKSSFTTQDGRYIYAKVSSKPELEHHFMVAQDEDEFTVVTKEDNLNELDLIEKNKDYYKLIELKVSVPFYAVGFLATVSNAIAEEGMNILIVSTYSKDYIMVREEHLEKAHEVLLSLGFKEKK